MRDGDLQLGVRDKVVTRMTREGAVEKNISKNSEKRVSARASDADFSHLREREELVLERERPDNLRSKVQQRRYYHKSEREEGKPTEDSTGIEDFAKDSGVLNGSDSENILSGNFGTNTDGAGTASDSGSGKAPGTKNSDAGSSSDSGVRSKAFSPENDARKESFRHNRKKKQTVDAQHQKKAESKLVFEEETASVKGTNLGGRFSSVSSKAAQTAGTAAGTVGSVVDSSLDAREEDNNPSEEALHSAENAAAAGTSLRSHSSRGHPADRTSARSSRSAAMSHEAEGPAGKLYFESQAESVSGKAAGAGKSASGTAGKQAAAETKAAGETAAAAKKEVQRQARNRRYAAMYRSSGRTAAAGKAGEAGASALDRLKNRTGRVLWRHKGAIVACACIMLGAVMVISSIGSMGSMAMGVGNSIFESTYLASDDEIYEAEEIYADMEAALQSQLDSIESRYPDYDEYRYQVDEISHNPYNLTSYLTVRYGNYTADEVADELEELFQEQYSLSVEGTTETITETRTVRVGESLGNVVTSGYCNCRICCGQWSGGPTASGAMPRSSHTIAVDAGNPLVPMGTKVVMNGVEYTVEDTGAFARYGVDFDVYYDSHTAASAHGHQTWEAYLSDSNGDQSVEVTDTRTVRVLNVTLTNAGFDTVARNRLDDRGGDEALNWYNILNASFGNRDYLWDTAAYSGYTPGGMSYEIPPEALTDERFRNMITEAERHLGTPYVWGGYAPGGFDCSGFVSYVINNCGNGWNYGRLTADGLRGICTYVSPSEAKPGDLIFFQGTYDTPGASHVGIYVGNGMMIHCGSPIQYTSIETNYWQQHFLCFGRIN